MSAAAWSLIRRSSTAGMRYGMALMKIGRFPEAIAAGKRATELRPNEQIGWTSLSLFYNRNGDIKEAEARGNQGEDSPGVERVARSRRSNRRGRFSAGW